MKNDKEYDPEEQRHYPEMDLLTAGLTNIFRGRGLEDGPLVVLDRQVNDYISTLPSEVVACKLAKGSELRLFCKYSAEVGIGTVRSRHGLAYEIEVYERILSRLPVEVPRFHGTYRDSRGVIWLVTDYVEEACQASLAPEMEAMPAGAAWCGHFHAHGEQLLRQSHDVGRIGNPSYTDSESLGELHFLVSHDADFYRDWSRHLLKTAEPVLSRHRWLPILCARYEEMIPLLTEQAPTVIHGEFTPHNLLWQTAGQTNAGKIFVIDWESAGIGVGEIDLATLVQGWDEAVIRACEDKYVQARWNGVEPARFRETLRAAHIYVAMHWLSGESKWTLGEGTIQFLEELRVFAEASGLL